MLRTRITAVVLTLWIGSLWTVCGWVAPTLFAMIDDRAVAGHVAAMFFRRESWFGLGLGVAAAILCREGALRARGYVYLGVAALLPVCSELFLSPLMQRARELDDRARFGMLHGVAGGLFLLACLGGLGLVVEFNRGWPGLKFLSASTGHDG